MKILKFRQFNEEVGGVELVGHMGPNYGEEDNDSMIGPTPADVIYSPITSKIYTQDDYQDMYINYLKMGGKPLHGFTDNNLTTVITFKGLNQS